VDAASYLRLGHVFAANMTGNVVLLGFGIAGAGGLPVVAPVVSLSIGASCLFRFGNTSGRSRPWTDVQLESGDLFVFGGPARLAYHGVPKTIAGTGDPDTGLPSGRLNITLRESGLT